METLRFDPRARAAALAWRNRARVWRERSGETVFHAFAIAAAAALAAALVLAQRETLVDLAAWAMARYPIALAVLVLLACGSDQVASSHRALAREGRDWIAAQPVSRRIQRRRHARAIGARAALHLGLVVVVCFLARVAMEPMLCASASAVAAAAFAPLAALRSRAGAHPVARRETPFALRRGSGFAHWQWIEAGASLAPRRLALMLTAILLVPRGPAMMVGVALVLVAATAVATAWQRMLRVFVQAQRWLEPQPVLPLAWLRRCLVAPLLLLALASAAIVVPAWLLDLQPLVWLGALVLPMLATLQLAAAACERRSAFRASLLALLHVVVLLAMAQALPPLVLPVWVAQLAWLARRGLCA